MILFAALVVAFALLPVPQNSFYLETEVAPARRCGRVMMQNNSTCVLRVYRTCFLRQGDMCHIWSSFKHSVGFYDNPPLVFARHSNDFTLMPGQRATVLSFCENKNYVHTDEDLDIPPDIAFLFRQVMQKAHMHLQVLHKKTECIHGDWVANWGLATEINAIPFVSRDRNHKTE